MSDKYTDEQLRLAARLYYIDGIGQVEIARFVKVSQPKVSRLLAMARERGIVRISVAEYASRSRDLERQLCKRFGLKSAVVVRTVEGLSPADARKTVAYFGAPVVSTMIPADCVVAIAGGRTMRELVDRLPEDDNRRVTVVQAMGNIDASVGPLDAVELGRSLAGKWGGSHFTLNTPAFVPDKKTRDTFLSLAQINSVWKRFNRIQVAMVGVGDLEDSVFVERGVLNKTDLRKLAAAGVVGEICGRFFDEDGNECATEWHDRVISIELDRLRKAPQVIGIVAGSTRCAAISAAIRGRLLKSLVIDDTGAEALLESSPVAKGPGKPVRRRKQRRS